MLVLVLHAFAPHLVEALDPQVLTLNLSQDSLLFLSCSSGTTLPALDLIMLLLVLALQSQSPLLNFILLGFDSHGLLLGRLSLKLHLVAMSQLLLLLRSL